MAWRRAALKSPLAGTADFFGLSSIALRLALAQHARLYRASQRVAHEKRFRILHIDSSQHAFRRVKVDILQQHAPHDPGQNA